MLKSEFKSDRPLALPMDKDDCVRQNGLVKGISFGALFSYDLKMKGAELG